MKYQKIIGTLIGLLWFSSAQAGVYELGGSFSWNRSNYSNNSFTWTRSWSGSFGYYFTQDSEVQFSFTDTTNREFQSGVQDVKWEDRVYSINMLYYLFAETSPFRPYFRVGVAQLNRNKSGNIAGTPQDGELDQVSVIGGLGFKIKISEKISLKMEATSYLTGGSIGSWQDNLTYNVGGAFYF